MQTTWPEMSTAERVMALGNLIAKNPKASLTELGVAVGASRNAIKGFLDRSGASLPAWEGAPPVETWTDETEAVLRKMWGQGASATQIAVELHTTRNAVIGKISRLKLPKRSSEAVRQAAVLSGKQSANRHHGLKFGTPMSNTPTLPADVDPKAFEPLPGSTPKSLTDLAPLCHDGTSAECHWPVGDGPIRFCGCATDGASRYCKVHVKRSGKMVPRLVLA